MVCLLVRPPVLPIALPAVVPHRVVQLLVQVQRLDLPQLLHLRSAAMVCPLDVKPQVQPRRPPTFLQLGLSLLLEVVLRLLLVARAAFPPCLTPHMSTPPCQRKRPPLSPIGLRLLVAVLVPLLPVKLTPPRHHAFLRLVADQ